MHFRMANGWNSKHLGEDVVSGTEIALPLKEASPDCPRPQQEA